VPQAEEVDWTFPVSVWDVVMMGRYGHMNFLRIPRAEDKRMVEEAWSASAWPITGPPDRRAERRAEEARLPRPRPRPAGPHHPARRALHRRRCADRGRHHRAAARAAAEGHIILVSTHNLGSVPEFCDQVVLINRTVLAYGPTEEVFTEHNLNRAFGGVLRQFHFEHSPSRITTAAP
jgi:manganese/iron transport system ATP-binding protein